MMSKIQNIENMSAVHGGVGGGGGGGMNHFMEQLQDSAPWP